MKTKKEYMDLLSAKMKEIDAKMNVLESKAETAGVKVRASYNEQKRELKKYREKAHEQWRTVKNSSDETWEEIKRDADRVIDDVKRFFGSDKGDKGDKAA